MGTTSVDLIPTHVIHKKVFDYCKLKSLLTPKSIPLYNFCIDIICSTFPDNILPIFAQKYSSGSSKYNC